MPTGPDVLLTLKVLVAGATAVLAAAVWAIATGRQRLHGRINTVFFALIVTTVVGFELLIRFGPDVTASFSDEARQALRVHLWFAVPAAAVLPVLYWSGWTGRRWLHGPLAAVFAVLWAGTFVTGLFFLPHGG